jgi:SAM-dependent methyltransferase
MSESETTKFSEMENLKKNLKATWTAGDFGRIARAYESGAAEFVERLGLREGETVLDVACGSGNTAIPAARAGASVTGVDIAQNLIEQARERAKAERLNCRFVEGDAEALDFEDGSFETIVTMFGAMFAPRPERVASELARVCRAGGRIVMANWTPAGFAGDFFKLLASYVAPPEMPSPVLWGDEKTVRERFRDGIADLNFQRRLMTLDLPFAPEEVVEHYRLYFGPVRNAFEALATEKEKQAALRREMVKLWTEYNRAKEADRTKVDAAYLEVIAKRA